MAAKLNLQTSQVRAKKFTWASKQRSAILKALCDILIPKPLK